MSDYISKLPDDILCHLLSFLTVRDSVKTRSLSYRWKDIPDCRSILQFDSLSVFGKDLWYFQRRGDEFVKAVDHFLKRWEGQKIKKFELEFGLKQEYNSDIDRWIAGVTRQGIEALYLDLTNCTGGAHTYILPCHLLHSKKASYLRHLRLRYCCVILCSGCKSWLGHLATLELISVTLRESDMEHILSNAVNLTSLTMILCDYETPRHINVRLPFLKKLAINVNVKVYLNCPYLESLDYTSYFCPKVTFSHLPFLREVYLWLHCKEGSCSSKFVDHLTRNAPKLQYLYLFAVAAVPPQLASIGTHCLKRLHLRLSVPVGFDLFTITDMLHASSSLEALHLEVSYRSVIRRSPEREYPDRPHCQLKEFKFKGYRQFWKEMEIVLYLLKNAIALQKLIIVPKKISEWRSEPKFNLLQGIHPTAELIIL